MDMPTTRLVTNFVGLETSVDAAQLGLEDRCSGADNRNIIVYCSMFPGEINYMNLMLSCVKIRQERIYIKT